MRTIKFTCKGINLLERIIIGAFLENPQEIQKAAKALNFELTPLIQKHLRRYLEIEEDLLRIKSGMKPKYNPRDYYRPK